MSDLDYTQEWLAKEANGSISRCDTALIDAEIQKLRNMIDKAEEQKPIQQWTKAELAEWCHGWCRTPHTTLKAFIDAGFCSDEAPAREEMRLLRQPALSTDSMTKPVMSELVAVIARLNRSVWDFRVLPNREDVRILLDAFRRVRYPEPPIGQCIRYRGWECCHVGANVAYQGQEGFVAHLGGVDLDAPQVDARTWDELLDEIDDHDMTEKMA